MLAKPSGNLVAPENTFPGVVQRAEGMAANQSALLPPIVKLIQAMTPDAEKYGAGKFLRLDTDEVFEALEIIPLVSRATQTKWPAQFSRDANPECWSSNGIQADIGAEREGQLCAQCPLYDPKPRRGKGRSQCETGHNLILLDANTYDPLGFRVRSTGNRIIGLVTSPSIAQQAVVRLYSERVSDDRGTWYQLRAKTLRRLDDADASLAKATMRAYLATNLGYAAPEGDDDTGADQRDASGQAGAAMPPSSSSPAATEAPTPAQRQGRPLDQRPRVDRSKFEGVTPELEGLPF